MGLRLLRMIMLGPPVFPEGEGLGLPVELEGSAPVELEGSTPVVTVTYTVLVTVTTGGGGTRGLEGEGVG